MASFVLIPGGGGDPWEWHRLMPELVARGHHAVAVRLPADDDAASWSDYADTVSDAVSDARDNVVLVASSMGGFTAPIVAARCRVDRLVLVNAMIPAPGETFNAWGSNTRADDARRRYHHAIGLSATDASDDAVIYYHDLPDAVRAEARSRVWQEQSSTPLDDPWPLTTWPEVATHAVSGRHDRMFPLEFQQQVARARLDIAVEVIDGGHLLALSNPGGLADQLDRHGRAQQASRALGRSR